MKVSKRKSAAILAAALSLTSCSQVLASDTDFAYYNGEKFIEFEFFNEGEYISQYTLADAWNFGSAFKVFFAVADYCFD